MKNRTVINQDLQSNATVINSYIAEKNDGTIINPVLQNSNATVINRDIVEEYNLQNNLSSSGSVNITEGTLVCGKYKIKNQMEVASGEADLYLCSDSSNLYVAKIYRRKFAVKQDVVDALMKINSPYVAKIYTTGSYNGYPVEIIPYYEKGSLQGHT